MDTPKLGNCPKCRKLYLKIRSICDECFQQQEDDYIKAASFLRDYPGCTIQELSDETGVTVAQIRQFILEGRIIAGDFPNLLYPCDTCGRPIRTGRVCKTCLDSINRPDNQIEKEAGNQHQERNGKSGGYITYL